MRRTRSGWAVAGMIVLSQAILCACSDNGSSDFVRRYGYGPDPTAADDASTADPNGGGGGSTASDAGGTPPPARSDAGAPPQTLTCTSCHGDANRTAIAGADPNLKSAPPVGTKGETAATARAVGAHQAHVNKADFRANPLACNECHVVPTSTNHSNGVVDLSFGTLAKTGNVTPTWSGTALTCTGSYCHGNFAGGNTAAAPSWTGGAMTCTSCHGGPPATGDHRRSQHVGLPCSNCHGTGYSSTTVNKALHMNGVKNAGGAGSMITYNAATRSCSPQCHGTETW